MPDMKAVADSSIIGVKKEKYIADFDFNTVLDLSSWSYSNERWSSRIKHYKKDKFRVE